MYGIYANIWGILMVNVTIYGTAYMDPMGIGIEVMFTKLAIVWGSHFVKLKCSILHISVS